MHTENKDKRDRDILRSENDLHFEKTKVKCCGASDRLQTNFVPQFELYTTFVALRPRAT
jgi:hypothetical protein